MINVVTMQNRHGNTLRTVAIWDDSFPIYRFSKFDPFGRKVNIKECEPNAHAIETYCRITPPKDCVVHVFLE